MNDPYEDAVGLKAPEEGTPRVNLLKYLCKTELILSNEIATLREALAVKELAYKDLIQSRIPDAVRANDQTLDKVTLDDGTVIELEDQCHVNFKKEHEGEVYDFLLARGNEKVLQYQFTIDCGKGTFAEARELQTFLSQPRYAKNERMTISAERYINPSTVKTLLKKLRSTVKLPDYIKVFSPTVAKIIRTDVLNDPQQDIFA
jgi:hypothetical protein